VRSGTYVAREEEDRPWRRGRGAGCPSTCAKKSSRGPDSNMLHRLAPLRVPVPCHGSVRPSCCAWTCTRRRGSLPCVGGRRTGAVGTRLLALVLESRARARGARLDTVQGGMGAVAAVGEPDLQRWPLLPAFPPNLPSDLRHHQSSTVRACVQQTPRAPQQLLHRISRLIVTDSFFAPGERRSVPAKRFEQVTCLFTFLYYSSL